MEPPVPAEGGGETQRVGGARGADGVYRRQCPSQSRRPIGCVALDPRAGLDVVNIGACQLRPDELDQVAEVAVARVVGGAARLEPLRRELADRAEQPK